MKTLTPKEYCPSLRAGWTLQDSIMRQVQKEDFMNHRYVPDAIIPKFEIRKVNWSKAVACAFGREIADFFRP